MIGRFWQRYRDSLSGLPREAWILALVMLINRSGVMVMPFMGLYLVSERGFEAAEMGYFLALAGFGSMVGVQAGGWLTDRFGHFAVQMSCLLLAAPLFLLLGAQTTTWSIAGALFALTVVVDGVRPAIGAAVAQHTRIEHRTRAFGLTRLAVNLGVTIGPALGGVLARIDYAWLFRVNALASVAAALVLLFLGRGWRSVHQAAGETPDAVDDRYSPWRDRRLLVFMLFLTIGAIPFFQVQGALPLYMQQVRGFTEEWIGALFAVNTVVIVLCELPLLHAIQDRSPVRVAAMGCLLSGVGFGLTPLWPGFAWIAFTVVVWTFGEMLHAPAAVSWVSTRGPERTRGRTMGLFGLGFAAAAVVGPLFGTSLYDHVAPEAPWIGCAILGAIGYLGLVAVARAEERG